MRLADGERVKYNLNYSSILCYILLTAVCLLCSRYIELHLAGTFSLRSNGCIPEVLWTRLTHEPKREHRLEDWKITLDDFPFSMQGRAWEKIEDTDINKQLRFFKPKASWDRVKRK